FFSLLTFADIVKHIFAFLLSCDLSHYFARYVLMYIRVSLRSFTSDLSAQHRLDLSYDTIPNKG
ncbi:hypothetical protein V1477_001134, partial [Vespula maculifrons]